MEYSGCGRRRCDIIIIIIIIIIKFKFSEDIWDRFWAIWILD
jgi:hypothetical protein